MSLKIGPEKKEKREKKKQKQYNQYPKLKSISLQLNIYIEMYIQNHLERNVKI